MPAGMTKGLSDRPLETFGHLIKKKKNIASADATKGLSGRPLDSFGPLEFFKTYEY